MRESRRNILATLFPHHLKYRIDQCNKALFTASTKNWESCTTLPKEIRSELEEKTPWMTLDTVSLFESIKKDTMKAVVSLEDDAIIETVLMRNAKGNWTICMSTQVGCAMGCTFCATGSMGMQRNLTEDEIIDQYRYWVAMLGKKRRGETISNIVVMGMGEPLANYEATRDALTTILKYTTLGPSHITVSSVGAIPLLKKVIDDPKWPSVRMAISLHSAVFETRKLIVPTMSNSFYEDLLEWCQQYRTKFPSRSLYLTFEYVMLGGVNDSVEEARALVEFVQPLGAVKVNLIPWNTVTGTTFKTPTPEAIEFFNATLSSHNVITMRRKTMGNDIEAACGQLVVKI